MTISFQFSVLNLTHSEIYLFIDLAFTTCKKTYEEKRHSMEEITYIIFQKKITRKCSLWGILQEPKRSQTQLHLPDLTFLRYAMLWSKEA